jgi:predicted ester cyclase
MRGTTSDAGSAADRWTFRGTRTGPLLGRPPTGRRTAFGGTDAVRVRDGPTTELRPVEDNAAPLGRLGVISLQMMDDRHTST